MSGRRFAFIAGSGMDPLASAMLVGRETRFDEIDGVGACGVEGHVGRILEGTIDTVNCTLVIGRRHVYEGDRRAVDRLVEWVASRGVTDLVMTSAGGGLHVGLERGDIVVARDIVDFQNSRPPSRGVLRIDAEVAARIEVAATRARAKWQRGTIVCGVGPAYETHAEVRVFQAWGDVATMSAAPELRAASRFGLRAAAIALVTNPCTGVSRSRPNHLEVLDVGRRACVGLVELIRQLIVLQ